MDDNENLSASQTEGQPVSEEETLDQAPEAAEESQQQSQPVEEPEVARARQGANERIQEIIRQRKQAEADRDRWQNLYLEAQRQGAQPQQPQFDPEAERQRLEMMGEVERVQYLVGQERARSQTQLSQMELRLQCQDDARNFERIIAANPRWERYRDEVEEQFHACLRRGQPRTREELLNNALGAVVRKNTADAVAKARKVGADNIQRQTTKPATVRSDVPSGSGRSQMSAEETLRRRLESGEYWR